MSGMGGKNVDVLQVLINQIIFQTIYNCISTMLCCQVSQLNLWQVCVSAWLVRQATPSNCGKLLLRHWYRSGVERSAQKHLGETQGYGKNPIYRDNPQPSSKDDAKAHLWMQFRDLMSVGQQRFVQLNNMLSMSWHKIKSVPLETGSVLRNYNWSIYPIIRRAYWVF